MKEANDKLILGPSLIFLFLILGLFILPLVLAESPPGEAWYYSHCPPSANLYLNLSKENMSAGEWDLTFYIRHPEKFGELKNEYLDNYSRNGFRNFMKEKDYLRKFDIFGIYFNNTPKMTFKTTLRDSFAYLSGFIIVLENKDTNEVYFSDLTNITYVESLRKNMRSDNLYTYEMVLKKFELNNHSIYIQFDNISLAGYGDGFHCSPPPMPEGYLGVPSNKENTSISNANKEEVDNSVLKYLLILVIILLILGILFFIIRKRRRSQ